MKIILWLMMGCQMLSWAWFSFKGGNLNNKQFLIFTVGMLLGQLGAGIETYLQGAFGSCIVQIYFFVFTLFAGYQRWRK